MKFLPKKLRDTDAQKKAADGFNEQLTGIEKIEDPADKIEALLKFKSDVSEYAYELVSPVVGRAVNVEMASIIGGIVGSVGITLGVMMLINPLVGIPVLFGCVGAGIWGSVKYDVSEKFADRMFSEMKDHMTAINDVLEKTSKGIGTLLAEKSNEIAASSKFDSIYDNYPEVRDSFIKTFNKAVARKELPPAPNPAPKFAL